MPFRMFLFNCIVPIETVKLKFFMSAENDNDDYVRFLKDEAFIEWKLFPTEKLDAHWRDYLESHPEALRDFKLAEKHFRSVNLSSHVMPNEMREEAVKRLERSLLAYNLRCNIRRFTYAAAACMTALVITLLYIQTNRNVSNDSSSHYIVGNEMESEDIQFITGNKTVSFRQNINIEIDSERRATIKNNQEESEEEITIDQYAMNKLIVPHGRRSEILLPDGTRAWLNSGSSLEFPSTFRGNSREIYLSGEIYLEVAPDEDRSFLLHVPGYEVNVHGTKFNVSSYSGFSSSVVLVEGSVSLRSSANKELLLSPEEQAIYSESTGTFERKKVDVQSFISWKEGYLTFTNTPVTVVLKQIERYYNLSFNLEDDLSFKDITCTGKIILSEKLDNVLTALSLISATKYKRENNLIYIYKT